MWTAKGQTKSVHKSEVSTLVKLGVGHGLYRENQTGREKSVHNGGVSTVVGCPQGEVLLYLSLSICSTNSSVRLAFSLISSNSFTKSPELFSTENTFVVKHSIVMETIMRQSRSDSLINSHFIYVDVGHGGGWSHPLDPLFKITKLWLHHNYIKYILSEKGMQLSEKFLWLKVYMFWMFYFYFLIVKERGN